MKILYADEQREIYEQSPAQRSITIVSPRYGLQDNFFLAFPYVIYIYYPQEFRLKALFKNEPVNLANILDGTYFYPPLPNIYDDTCEVCLGDIGDKRAFDEKWSAEQTIGYFWQTTFSEAAETWDAVPLAYQTFTQFGEPNPKPQQRYTPRFGGYFTWQAMSKNDLLSVLKIKWPEIADRPSFMDILLCNVEKGTRQRKTDARIIPLNRLAEFLNENTW
jgi:hypothetical protein